MYEYSFIEDSNKTTVVAIVVPVLVLIVASISAYIYRFNSTKHQSNSIKVVPAPPVLVSSGSEHAAAPQSPPPSPTRRQQFFGI